MKGNPAVPGGPSTSKPAWSNTPGCPTTPAFCFGWPDKSAAIGDEPDGQVSCGGGGTYRPEATQFEQRQTGQMPRSVTVVLSDDTRPRDRSLWFFRGGTLMTHRLRAVAFDVDAASLISLREALPEWEIEVVNGATAAS